jgi:hypothetical protein
MKIINKTKYDTKDLRKVFTETLKRNEKFEGKLPQKKKLIVYVKSSRGSNHVSGRAPYNGYWIKIFLPKENPSLEQIAAVFDHEVYHLRGYHHNAIGRFLKPNYKEEFAWAACYPIKDKQEKKKVKNNLKEQRYQKVLAKIEEKQKAIKRLQNQLKKYILKKKYYERVLKRVISPNDQ